MPIVDPQYPKWPASGRMVREMLGLNPLAHLPAEGTEWKQIQGYQVHVESKASIRKVRSARKPHRIVAVCKRCGMIVSAGRLAQHEKSSLCKEA